MNGATFSKCRIYRYRLWRSSMLGSGRMVAVMLNPSTADETINDPTVDRVWRRAQEYGYARLDVLNIFAFRSTDPKALYSFPEPVGPDNDATIIDVCSGADLVLCGWGTHGIYMGRGNEVASMLHRCGIELHCLGETTTRQPKHPLYIGYSTTPIPYHV